MSNPSRRIGTEGEQSAVSYWEKVWPYAERKGGNAPSNDIAGVPFHIEVKRQKVLKVPDWSRKLLKLHGNKWGLHLVPRDKRLNDAHPEMVCFPIDFAVAMVDFCDKNGFDWRQNEFD
jgi:hypothetical protein